jgi:O-methyltransferase domain
LASGEWAEIYSERERYICALLAPSAQGLRSLLRNFFRNEGLKGLWCYRYYPLKAIDKVKILHDVIQWALRHRRPVEALDVPRTVIGNGIGNPFGLHIGRTLVLATATRHHDVASTIGSLRPKTVFEIGSGFGGMAYFLLKNFPSIKYTAFDLPEVLVVAQYYLLNSIGPEFNLYGEDGRFANSLLPHFCIKDIQGCDLVVNTNSLPEMPPETRADYLRQIARISNQFLSSNRPFDTDFTPVWKRKVPWWSERSYGSEMILFRSEGLTGG